MRATRWSTTFALTLALTVCGTALSPLDAGAVVVCQRKNKVRLRADACKAKETKLFDTAEVGVERGRVDAHDELLDAHDDLLGAHEDLLGAHEQRLADAEVALNHRCEGAPERRVLPLGIEGGADFARCRTLDDEPAACAQSFQFHGGGATACAYVAGNCIACEPGLHAAGVCENVCQPFSCADDTRETGAASCDDVATQGDCEESWSFSLAYRTPERAIQAVTCYWDTIGGDCDECTPQAASNNVCTNTCLAPSELPPCRAAGEIFGHCDEFDGNEAGCTATYMLTLSGTQTCWYEGGACEACDPVAELAGKCTNDC